MQQSTRFKALACRNNEHNLTSLSLSSGTQARAAKACKTLQQGLFLLHRASGSTRSTTLCPLRADPPQFQNPPSDRDFSAHQHHQSTILMPMATGCSNSQQWPSLEVPGGASSSLRAFPDRPRNEICARDLELLSLARSSPKNPFDFNPPRPYIRYAILDHTAVCNSCGDIAHLYTCVPISMDPPTP